MSHIALFALAVLLGTPAAAQEAAAPTVKASDYDLAKEKVLKCAGEKFLFAWGEGAHPTKVTLCSDKGATNEQVIAMIRDAANKIEANLAIREDRRTALVQQMRSKIVELEARSAPAK